MEVDNWNSHKNKRFQREHLFCSIPSVKNYLTLCGPQALDVVEGIRQNVLGDTYICAVERNAVFYQQAQKWFDENYNGSYNIHNSELHQVKLNRRYNLVFLDFLGNVGKNEILWMQSELLLAPRARVALTSLKSFRGNKFFANLFNELHEKVPDLIKKDAITWRNQGNYSTDMLGYLSVYSVLIKTFIFPKQCYHISAYYYGENTASVMMFFTIDFKEGNRLLTQEEIYAQQVISGILGVPKQSIGESIMAPASANQLVDKFLAMPKNYDSMRGFKASLTQFCQKKERETGTPAVRFRAAIKAVITRKGGDSTSL